MRPLRLAFRSLFKTPLVSSVAVASLALGIGANTAIFSMYDQLLRRPLPVPAPAELVNLSDAGIKPGSTSSNNSGSTDDIFSYPMFRDLEREQTAFTGLAGYRLFQANLSYAGQTASGQGLLVSGSYFSVLRLRPTLGRLLDPADDRVPGASALAVLSHAFWRTRFGARSDVLGARLTINGQAFEIVGVAAPGFEGTTLGSPAQVFVPLTMRERLTPGWTGFDNRRSYWAYCFARLKPGVTLKEAEARLNGPYRAIIQNVEAPLQQGLSAARLEQFKARSVRLSDGRRGQSQVHGQTQAPVLLLLAVTGLVLLTACANIANLLLARGAGRLGEMAVRLSIGASRRQLVAQLLGEACLLSTLGALSGLLVARGTLSALRTLLPAQSGTLIDPGLAPSVFLFAGALALVTGLAFGLVPALQSTRVDLATALRNQAGRTYGTPAATRFRTALATAQVALSMTLLVCAGLFTRSLANVSRVDLGLRTERLLTFGISPELSGYRPEQSHALFARLEEELQALPGVTAVSSAMVPLLSGSNWGNDVSVEGFRADPDTDTNARFNAVGPGYLHTLGITLLAGREFERRDALGSAKVALVNEAFARKFNLGSAVVGKHIGLERGGALDVEIVGLVRDAHYSEVKQAPPPQYFIPYRQDNSIGSLSFYVRAGLDGPTLLAAIPALMRRLDPNLPVEELRPMELQVRDNTFLDRLITVLSLAFASLATLLAGIGLYGVLAFTFAQRTRELGVRMALGADPARIRALVLAQVARMTAVGGVLGLAGAIALGWAAGSLLFGLQSHDPWVLAGALLVLSAVAFTAGAVPAWRAARLDPLLALRYE